MAGMNPIHADSLNFPNHQSVSYPSFPAFQPDALAIPFPSSNHLGGPTIAPVTNPNRWAAKETWARHQTLIKQLYLYEKKPLKEVMRLMESQHGFRATVKMYKTHIRQWGLDKKNKDFEMRAIVRKKNQREHQGKSSIFRVRGQHRDFSEVVRYWNRKGVSTEDIIARKTASPTPDAVECFTPIPSPILTPQVLAIPERMFLCIRDYFRGSFESGTWVRTEPFCSCYSIKNGQRDISMYDVIDHCDLACRLFSRNLFKEAGQTLIAATAVIKTILLIEDPETILRLLDLLNLLREWKRDEVALIIFQHFSALGQILLGSEHPVSRICEWIVGIDPSSFDDVIIRCMRSIADQFESFVGPVHQSSISSRIVLIDMVREGSARVQMLQNLLGECEKTLRPDDLRTMQVRMHLAVHYFEQSEYVEAKILIQKNLACLQTIQPMHDAMYDDDQSENLYMAARCHYAVGEVDLGIATLQRAMDSKVSIWGPKDSRTRIWLVVLEDWYLEQGHWSSAAQVRVKREKTLELMDID